MQSILILCKAERVNNTDRSNWQDWGGRWTRRTVFMRNLKTILEELEVSYSMPLQPVLLPKYSPFTTSFPNRGHNEEMNTSSVRRNAHNTSETLGNAGYFMNEGFRAPGPTFRS